MQIVHNMFLFTTWRYIAPPDCVLLCGRSIGLMNNARSSTNCEQEEGGGRNYGTTSTNKVIKQTVVRAHVRPSCGFHFQTLNIKHTAPLVEAIVFLRLHLARVSDQIPRDWYVYHCAPGHLDYQQNVVGHEPNSIRHFTALALLPRPGKTAGPLEQSSTGATRAVVRAT